MYRIVRRRIFRNKARPGAETLDIGNDLSCELGRGRCSRRYGNTLLPRQQFRLEIGETFDAYGRATRQVFGNLYETVGVVAAWIADDDGQISITGHFSDSFLPQLGRHADFVIDLYLRIALANSLYQARCIPLTEGSLSRNQ